jgi:hypothetical protein
MRLRIRSLASALLLVAATTAGIAGAANQTGYVGGGDTGAAPPTVPPSNMCYLAMGIGSNFGLIYVGGGRNQVSINWTLPAGSYSMKTRLYTTSATGTTSYDTDWVDMTHGARIPGGQTGTSSNTFGSDVDFSGGLTYESQFTDANGTTISATGMIYPPDPYTNAC